MSSVVWLSSRAMQHAFSNHLAIRTGLTRVHLDMTRWLAAEAVGAGRPAGQLQAGTGQLATAECAAKLVCSRQGLCSAAPVHSSSAELSAGCLADAVLDRAGPDLARSWSLQGSHPQLSMPQAQALAGAQDGAGEHAACSATWPSVCKLSRDRGCCSPSLDWRQQPASARTCRSGRTRSAHAVTLLPHRRVDTSAAAPLTSMRCLRKVLLQMRRCSWTSCTRTCRTTAQAHPRSLSCRGPSAWDWRPAAGSRLWTPSSCTLRTVLLALLPLAKLSSCTARRYIPLRGVQTDMIRCDSKLLWACQHTAHTHSLLALQHLLHPPFSQGLDPQPARKGLYLYSRASVAAHCLPGLLRVGQQDEEGACMVWC